MTTTNAAQLQGVTLTSSAAAKVRELIEAEGDSDMALRVGVKRSGCSGYAYDMFFDSKIDSTDIVNETDGVRVVVDADSVSMVTGAIVDFKDDGLSGAGFAIENPNVSGTCGCGKSFS
ncbi:MAG: iron-sulfur cluster assembly accessory protein [Acidobacteria bacterium]|nr:MAG: iron-sulfur cluster assembly accessory protein [Acidobacteriota bacterium]